MCEQLTINCFNYFHQTDPSSLAQYGQRFPPSFNIAQCVSEKSKKFLKKKKDCIPGDLFISEGRQKATYKKT